MGDLEVTLLNKDFPLIFKITSLKLFNYYARDI